MDMRKYNSGFIKASDLHDGPRVEVIVNIYEDKTFGRPVLEFESGAQFSVNATNNSILIRAYGWDSKDWLNQTIQLELGHYKDWETKEEKETVVVKPISTRQPSADNGKAPSEVAKARTRDQMDDEIPF